MKIVIEHNVWYILMEYNITSLWYYAESWGKQK